MYTEQQKKKKKKKVYKTTQQQPTVIQKKPIAQDPCQFVNKSLKSAANITLQFYYITASNHGKL
jgi:hypothetical protein